MKLKLSFKSRFLKGMVRLGSCAFKHALYSNILLKTMGNDKFQKYIFENFPSSWLGTRPQN